MTSTRASLTGMAPGLTLPGSPEVRERARALRATVEAMPGPPMGEGTGGPRVIQVVGVDVAADEVGRMLAGAFAESRQRTLLVEASPPPGGAGRRPGRDEVEDQIAAALRAGTGDRGQGTGDRGTVAAGRSGPGGLVGWGASREGPHAIPAQATGSPYLAVVPHGELNEGAPVMPPDRWAALLAWAREERDRVIVVASPLSRRADGLTLARLVDGTILVLTPGQTTATAAARAQDAIRQAGGSILGVVLADR